MQADQKDDTQSYGSLRSGTLPTSHLLSQLMSRIGLFYTGKARKHRKLFSYRFADLSDYVEPNDPTFA
ncbi:hypothetical protein TNCV_4924801 [Trichonephila clavipes]|nr:hypothetical protein TNCV_4924801 [Trichonephila clavipes]